MNVICIRNKIIWAISNLKSMVPAMTFVAEHVIQKLQSFKVRNSSSLGAGITSGFTPRVNSWSLELA